MDKVQKIREEVEKKLEVMQYQVHRKDAYKELKDVLAYIDELQKEPVSEKKCMFTKDSYTNEDRKVLCEDCKEKCEYNKKEEPISEDLEEASKEWLRPQLDKSYANYGEAKMMELTHFDGYAMFDAIEFGAKWQEINLWKPADGDDLPEIDREVIALLDNGKVVFAHRPPEFWDGKNIITGKVTRNYPKTYDKGGWNIPNVKYWLDCLMPKEIEL